MNRFGERKSQVITFSAGCLWEKNYIKCSVLSLYYKCSLCMCGWIISLYCVAFGLSQKCFPRSKKGLRLRGLGWDFHFLETPSVLFCMVPPGTKALIFLEGMFREPPSPRGKDNGGCDVTSILGASGGKEKSWVALMSSGTPFLEEFHNIRGGLKMVPVQPNIWTPTPVHVGATHSLPSGAVNSLLDERKKLAFT